MRLSRIAKIIGRGEVCVICQSQRKRWITQTEALIISLSCENRIQQLFYVIVSLEAF